MKRLIAVILALSTMLTLLSGCGGSGGGGKSKNQTLSPEAASATLGGVTVDAGAYVLDGETELSVQRRDDVTSADEDYKIESYDISLGEMSQLDDYITIRIPYDDSYCEEGQNAAQCVGAKYLNETTGEWENVLFEVDEAAKELVIYTDHLSVYGAFHVKNEGKRNAYITDVNTDITGVAADEAMAALQEYVANGGEAGKEAVGLAAKIVAGVNSAAGTAADVGGNVSFGTDLAGNIINLATLADPRFSSKLAEAAFDGMGNLGKVAAAVKIGAVMLKSDKTDEDVLGLYKDTANLALSFSKSKAIGMAMCAIFVFDYTISEMFAQGMEMKRGKINAVYQYYNDEYAEGLYKARDLKDWRAELIRIVEEDPENAAAAIEAEIDRYSNAFWNTTDDVKQSAADSLDKTGTQGGAHLPMANSAEAKQMTLDYKAALYERLYPVVNSVSIYMQRKAEAEYLKALDEMKTFLNQSITVKFTEDLEEGEAPKYAGYSMRFEPLAEGVEDKTWIATQLGEKGATGQTKFTLIGFLTAGAPNNLAVYKPGDTPGAAEPELKVPFVLDIPVTEVTVGIEVPAFEELVGTYEDGVFTITEVFVSDSLKAALADSEGAKVAGTDITIEGCDAGFIIAALQENVGKPTPSPFTITASGENVGLLALDPESPSSVTYDPSAGILTADFSEDGQNYGSGKFNCTYNEDKTGVILDGTFDVFGEVYSPEDFRCDITMTGTKALTAPAAPAE